MLEAEGLRDKVILACGGRASTYDWPRSWALTPASALNTYANEWRRSSPRMAHRCTANRKRSRIPEPPVPRRYDEQTKTT